MLCICRSVCALSLALDACFLFRWHPSEPNVADKPSRAFEPAPLKLVNASSAKSLAREVNVEHFDLSSGSGLNFSVAGSWSEGSCAEESFKEESSTCSRPGERRGFEGAALSGQGFARSSFLPAGDAGFENTTRGRRREGDELGEIRKGNADSERVPRAVWPVSAPPLGGRRRPYGFHQLRLDKGLGFQRDDELHQFGARQVPPALEAWRDKTFPRLPRNGGLAKETAGTDAGSASSSPRVRGRRFAAAHRGGSSARPPDDVLNLRSSSGKSPTSSQRLRSSGSSVAFYSINLNPEEGPEASKVGARNESIMLDDVELPWLA